MKIQATAADAARWGYLWLRGGRWRDRQVVDEWFVTRTLEPMPKPGGGFAEINEGWQIHLNRGGKWKGLPLDSFAALGAGSTSVIFVCPSLDLVIARRGVAPKHADHIEEFLKPIVDAVRSTKVSLRDNKWHLNGAVTYRGTKAEGLFMNVRMVNAVFEDANDKPARPVQKVPQAIREEIEWLNVWVPGNSVKGLPRVLLIGDSITQGYYKDVADRLNGKAVVARLTTSKSSGDAGLLAEVKLVLSPMKFDVIHFNNGLHGWGYTEEEYAKGLPDLVDAIRKAAPHAKLVWAATTPLRASDNPDQTALRKERGERVKARNKIAAEVMAKQKVPINDLYSLAADKLEWYSRDGTHFNDKGKAALGAQVAEQLERVLKDVTYFPPP